MKAKLDKQTSVYVIGEDYRLIYFNDVMENTYPGVQLGQTCHKSICREDTPCGGCPLGKEKQGKSVFYNKALGKWLSVSKGSMEWPGKGACHIILSDVIEESKKELFYNMGNINGYDELVEINILEDSYQVLYLAEDKYAVPSKSGQYSQVIMESADWRIHPGDRERFLEFFKQENLERILGKTSVQSIERGEFRRRKTGSGWVWTQYVLISAYQEEEKGKIVCFVKDIQEEKQWEEYIKNNQDSKRNNLTGLYGRPAFYEAVEEELKTVGEETWYIIALDIEHFKLFNEWYGEKEGDTFLKEIALHLKYTCKKKGGVVGYFGDDDFALFLPDAPEQIEALKERILEQIKRYERNTSFLPAFGIYEITDPSIPVSRMYDMASIAMKTIKGNYGVRIKMFDDTMIQKLQEEHLLLCDAQRALEQQEFTFFLQPKCNMENGKIVGAEALVRWNHCERGLIPPVQFLPQLENLGFIPELDYYIWREVCKWHRQWIDRGLRPIPVSVNVSRTDFYSMDVPRCFRELIKTYDLEPSLVDIEITESAYAEDSMLITSVVGELRKQGFHVLMDDFGSGYSSLNMLKDVVVDVLKIDMKFLEMDEETSDRGVGILEAVINMARLMGMRIIVEGVETWEQRDFLVEMGCEYGQGYYFYRPMPREKFEPLLANTENLDLVRSRVKKLENLRLRDLLEDNLFTDNMVNNILGAIGFFEMDEEGVRIIRVSQQYLRLVGKESLSQEEDRRLKNHIVAEDWEKLLQMFKRARKNRYLGGSEIVRYKKDEQTILWISARVFFWRVVNGKDLYYGSITDVTERERRKENLHDLSQNMKSMMRLAGINGFSWNLLNNNLKLINVAQDERLAELHKCLKISKAVVPHFPQSIIESSLLTPEYEEKLKNIAERVAQASKGDRVELKIPFQSSKGEVEWISGEGEVICNEKNEPVKIVGYYRDITEQKKREGRLRRMARTDALTGLFNRHHAMPTIKKRLEELGKNTAVMIMLDMDNFKRANDVYGHAFGDKVILETAKLIRRSFREEDLVCRVGGDEFLVFCDAIKEDSVCRRISHIIQEMEAIGFEETPCTLSLTAGYVMIPEQGISFEDLYSKADIAMFCAKMKGKKCFAKYDPSMKSVRHEM